MHGPAGRISHGKGDVDAQEMIRWTGLGLGCKGLYLAIREDWRNRWRDKVGRVGMCES